MTGGDRVRFVRGGKPVLEATLAEVERAFKRPLDLDGTLLQEVSR